MIKHTPLPDTIHERLPRVETYLKNRSDVWFAYLFGGLATGRVHPLSDVDIAVYLAEGDFSEKRLTLLGDLTNLLKTDEIDLVILNTAPLTLRMEILRPRRIIADNRPFKRHVYESLTVRSYLDFSKRQKRMLERRFLNG